MNDVEKTNIERKNSGKRMRRRKRNMNLYAFVVLAIVAAGVVSASLTFLFTVDNIVISGESETYTYMEIINASGINAGDNLIRLNTKEAENRILDNMLYVETADITKDFPSTVKINVTRCIPAFNVPYDSGVLLVSRKGKILSNNNYFVDEYPIIYGYEPDVFEQGQNISSSNENKNEAFEAIVSRLNKDKDADESQAAIANIDMTDEFSIIVNYRSGMIFKMGNWNDVEYKLELASSVMNDPSVKGKKGYLTMIGSNQCSFRSSGEAADSQTLIQTPTGEAATGTGTATGTDTSASSTAVTTETTAVTTAAADNSGYGGDTQWSADTNSGYSGDTQWSADTNNGYGGDTQWSADTNNGYSGDNQWSADTNNGYGGDNQWTADANNGYGSYDNSGEGYNDNVYYQQ